MESIPPQARLKDVAAAAGVSVSTASRVLSGANAASPQAVAAVRAASARLNYRPNPIARALRAQTTNLIGMVVPEVGNPFFAELIEAVERALHEAELDLLLAGSFGSVKDEARRIQTMLDRRTAGLIVIPLHHHASTAALTSVPRTMPIVQIDRQVDGFHGDYVGVDNALGIQLVLQHLAEQGCRRVTFVSDVASSSTGRSRLEAFDHSIRRVSSLTADDPLLGSFAVDFGREAVRTLIREQRLPEGIVCGSDIIALGVVRELHQAGVAIPEQVRVTGFDGIQFSELCDPPLTTVRQPVNSIASEAIRILTARLQGSRAAPVRTEVAPTLEIRRSSPTDQGSTIGAAVRETT